MVEHRRQRLASQMLWNDRALTRTFCRALTIGSWLLAACPTTASAASAEPAPPASAQPFKPTGLLAGHFRLATPEGRLVDNLEGSDKPYALFFGFTHCPDVCPTVLYDLTAAMKKLPRSTVDAMDVYFISVDPERDTPALMAEYMQSFDPHIVALTGSRADVDEAIASFGVSTTRFAEPDGTYTFSHSASVLLVDGNGIIVDTLGPDLGADALAERLKNLTKPTGRGRQ